MSNFENEKQQETAVRQLDIYSKWSKSMLEVREMARRMGQYWMPEPAVYEAASIVRNCLKRMGIPHE